VGVEFAEIRRLAIVAMFADEWLMERLVLKGGNALSLIHGIGGRTSLDLDFSMEGDFDDLGEAERRLHRSLEDRFDAAGYVAFDLRLRRKPADPTGRPPTWGGYLAEFKLIDRRRFDQLGSDGSRRQSLTIGPGTQRRVFRVEISKHEFCADKEERDLDGFTIYVYTPAMIAIEKLRAICQQMPEYTLVRYKTARARDFYDIYCILTEHDLDWSIPEHLELVRGIFEAKDVPLSFIPKIPETREFHRLDWPAVQDSVSGPLESYDYYFDAVVEATIGLYSLWEE
jgi:predicted nucleotidyltransferase component of viral defense system